MCDAREGRFITDVSHVWWWEIDFNMSFCLVLAVWLVLGPTELGRR